MDNDPSRPLAPCKIYNISYNYYSWALEPRHYLKEPAEGNLNNISRQSADWIDPGFRIMLLTKMSGLLSGDLGFMDEDLRYDHATLGPMTIYRLREGVERFLITDINNPAASAKAQGALPVMHDMIGVTPSFEESFISNHIPGGGNVLYMDGHVEFLRYPTLWPVCATWSTFMSDPISLLL
jgi:prepilin-type processing-associated H-X9-DG protein